MNSKDILAKSIELVVFLFGAFGHFLTRIAPPDSSGLSFSVGFSSFISLSILLVISLISKNLPIKKRKKAWLIPGILLLIVGFFSTAIYWNNFHEYTFEYPADQPQGRHLEGTKLTKAAIDYMNSNPNANSAEMVADFGGLPFKTKVWSKESLIHAENLMTVNYVILVLSLAAAIFCLLEGLLVSGNKR